MLLSLHSWSGPALAIFNNNKTRCANITSFSSTRPKSIHSISAQPLWKRYAKAMWFAIQQWHQATFHGFHAWLLPTDWHVCVLLAYTSEWVWRLGTQTTDVQCNCGQLVVRVSFLLVLSVIWNMATVVEFAQMGGSWRDDIRMVNEQAWNHTSRRYIL